MSGKPQLAEVGMTGRAPSSRRRATPRWRSIGARRADWRAAGARVRREPMGRRRRWGCCDRVGAREASGRAVVRLCASRGRLQRSGYGALRSVTY